MRVIMFILPIALGFICFAAASSLSLQSARDLKLSERCDDDPAWCAKGLKCVGPQGKRRCFPIKTQGELCKAPYIICDKGLECKRHRCSKILLEEGESCNNSYDMCRPPLSCVGSRGDKKCYEKGDEGDSCGGEPFWVCKDHLKCKHGVCTKILLKKGASCNKPTDMCKSPLSCVGNKGDMQCYKKRREGQSCEDPFWVCEEGLLCNDSGRCEDPWY